MFSTVRPSGFRYPMMIFNPGSYFLSQGRLPELRVACYIGSMDKPLSLALFGEVRGPDVLFRCVEQE